MVTSIQVSEKLQNELNRKKIFKKETYEEVIWNLIEDSTEISEETKRSIASSEKEYREGKVHTLAEVKKELGI